MSEIKLEEAELKEIQELRQNYQQIMFQLGQAELQLNDLKSVIADLEKTKTDLFSKYASLKQDEQNKLNALNKKYGIGTLNLETGIFSPSV